MPNWSLPLPRGRVSRSALTSLAVAAFAASLLSVPAEATAEDVVTTCASTVASSVNAAQALAVSCGTSVEALDARTPYTQVVADPAGTMTMASSLVPRWVPRSDGSWADVDTSVEARADGRYAPIASLADVSFSPGGDTVLASLHSPTGQTLTLSWPSPLPAGMLDGDAVLYPEVFPEVDLRVRATPTGFTHTLVVKTAAAAANPALARIPYVLGGDVSIAETAQGGLSVVAGGELFATADPAVMWDSTTLSGSAARSLDTSSVDEAGDGAQIAPVEIDLAGQTMALVPDPDLLTGPDTVFPVYIDPDFNTDEKNWAYANNANTTWGATPTSALARVGRDPDPSHNWLYRSMFRFPTDANGVNLDGKQILNAHFVITLYHSYDCAPTSVYLYRSRTPTSPRTSWTNAKLDKYLTSKSAAANKGVCYDPEDPKLDFTSTAMKTDVQLAAKEKWNYYTVALSARDSGGAGESTQGRWKKFDQSTALFKVEYNSYPDPPSEMKVGSTYCEDNDEILKSGSTHKLSAKFGDDDKTQQTLTGKVYWRQVGAATWTVKPTSTTVGNERASYQLPALQDGHYEWYMQSNDGVIDSKVSKTCRFEVDSSSPAPPEIDSLQYLECDPDVSCPVNDVPGLTADFTFSTADDAVKYLYDWSASPLTPVMAPSIGAAVTIPLTPPSYGDNVLYVRSVDAAGNQSGDATYWFKVARASPAIAGWGLEDGPASEFPALTNTVFGGQNLTTSGALSWSDGVRLVGASTAQFNNGGWAETPNAVLDTSKSFSIGAWVRLASTATSGTIVGQDGTYNNGIYFGYVASSNKWEFRFTTNDSADYAWAPNAVSDVVPKVGIWTHLAATYDAKTGDASIFVDGALQGGESTVHVGSHWSAPGKMRLGAGLHKGVVTDFWRGHIAQVRVFNRVIGVDDIVEGANDLQPLMAATPVGRWDFDTDCCGTAVNRLIGWGHDLSLQEPAIMEQLGSGYALQTVDGSGYAQTEPTADLQAGSLNTDQSFTVAAWVQLGDLRDFSTAVSQDGVNMSAFRLQNRKVTIDGVETSQWCMTMRNTDEAGSGITKACTTEASTLGLTHLLGVYDAARGEIRLYVNGAQINDSGELLPSATATMAARMWDSTGRVGVGRGQDANSVTTANPDGDCDMFSGFVDDVQVFQGAMTTAQANAFYDSVRGA
ncbi:LamG domain-containing protein [Phytomonospora endophytica]|uniref:LamG-like jellyroll fold domain-containing protein n=1 Tax=Phytomonospora endophytica TaxID=714109 RepID=A0A841FMP2_9ACTN|nr:LamG domain-containing protein [Phytomonospora endophytica]MBB6038571.1 hypothetical protein [Phytomonospora endophytica]GIG69287.1 hypothetical protein Pen01_55820 [Phytomonospora endophytica]